MRMSKAEAEATATLFKALADPARVRIVNTWPPPGSPCASATRPARWMSRSTVSFHMKKLMDAGLLEREQRGVWAYYSLRNDARQRLRSSLRFRGGQPWMSFERPSATRYAAAATSVKRGLKAADDVTEALLRPSERLRAEVLRRHRAGRAPRRGRSRSLGCGNPTAVADLAEGETVLDPARVAGSTSCCPPAGSVPRIRLRPRHDR